MKKLPVLLLYAIVCAVTGFSCMHNDHDVSFRFTESEHSFSMNAHFSRNQTRAVDKYMDSRIGRTNNMSFVNSRIDGKLTLDDHTTFYIKKSPGIVEIKLDKDENSEDAYRRIKSMCEGIKGLVASK